MWCKKSVLIGRGVCSFQFSTTESQVRSGRKRWSAGLTGFLLPKRKPEYLKLTMSPISGFHLFTNSVEPPAALNVTPLGLLIVREPIENQKHASKKERGEDIQDAFPGISIRTACDFSFGISEPLIEARHVISISILLCSLPCVSNNPVSDRVCRDSAGLAE